MEYYCTPSPTNTHTHTHTLETVVPSETHIWSQQLTKTNKNNNNHQQQQQQHQQLARTHDLNCVLLRGSAERSLTHYAREAAAAAYQKHELLELDVRARAF